MLAYTRTYKNDDEIDFFKVSTFLTHFNVFKLINVASSEQWQPIFMSNKGNMMMFNHA